MKLRKFLCKYLKIHYRPIRHYDKNNKLIKWWEFWKDPMTTEFSIKCEICNKI